MICASCHNRGGISEAGCPYCIAIRRHAWPKAKRRQDMAGMVKLVADTARRLGIDVATAINGLDSIHVARTYGGGILPCEVDAEKMKHLSEGDCGK